MSPTISPEDEMNRDLADLAVGARLRGVGDNAEVIVVQPPAGPVDLRYGGLPMLREGDVADGTPGMDAAEAGIELGKRYVHDASGLQLLCVKPGAGALSVDGEALTIMSSKQLPASD